MVWKDYQEFCCEDEPQDGLLGTYNSDVGLSPFERYELGGDGISNFQGLQGKEIISLRGYRDPVTDVSQANRTGAAIYNKFTMELRYLISPNQMQRSGP